MSNYNDSYYIAFKYNIDETLYLKALKRTSDRRYSYKKMKLGDEPLFFENAYKEKDKKIDLARPIKSAHMNMNHLVVSNEIYSDLKRYKINGFQLYPSVIIDDNNNYNENYWFFNKYELLDALDYNKCVIDEYDPSDDSHDVEKYHLSSLALDKIPEEQRLIFTPQKADMGHTFVHKKIVDIFNKHNVDTIKFIKVSDWEAGMQFQ